MCKISYLKQNNVLGRKNCAIIESEMIIRRLPDADKL